jgi:hypothetical protein
MTTEPKNASQAGDRRARRELEEKLQPLLQEMLARLRRYRDMPLQDGIDGAGIVQAALRSLSAGPSAAESSHLPDLGVVKVILDGLIERALGDEGHSQEGERSVPAAGRLDGAGGNGAGLAVWLEHLHAALRGAHPAAVEIVGLRVEGCQDREIAQRLGLGLRLVRRIIRDLRPAWEQALQTR